MRLMPESVAQLLRRLLLDETAPGTRVLRSRWPVSMEVVREDGSRVTSVAAGAGLGGDLRMVTAGEGSFLVEQEMLGGARLGSGTRLAARDARDLYRRLQRQLLANAPGTRAAGAGRWLVAVAAVALLAYAAGGGYGHDHEDERVVEAPAADSAPARSAGGPAAGALSERSAQQPRVTATEMTMLQAVAGRGGLSMASKGQAFYVFSDPNCPYCQKLERTIEQLGDGHRPVIIPVAYKNGSKEIVQDILCTKDAKAAVRKWREALAGTAQPGRSPSASACAQGLEVLTDNMTLFEMLKLTGTPAVISASGRMFSGASGATVEQLRAALELP